MLMSSIDDIRYQNQEIEKIYNMNEIVYDATQEKITEIDRTLWDYFRTGCRVYFEHPYFAPNFAFDPPSNWSNDQFPIHLKSIEFLTLHDYIQQDNLRKTLGLNKYEIQVSLYQPMRHFSPSKGEWYSYTFIRKMPYPKNLNQNGTVYFELYSKYNSEAKYNEYYMYIITTGTKILLPNDLSFFFVFKRTCNLFFDGEYYSNDRTSVSQSLQSIKFNNIVKIKNNQNPVNLLCFCSWNSKLSSIDFNTLEIHKTNNLQQLFDTNSLINLNIGNITILPNTKMISTFKNSYYLTSLDLSNLDTLNVDDMSNVFKGCNSLTSLNLSNFDTSNVTNMNYMFDGCNSLTSLNLSSFNTSNVHKMQRMFSNCSSLISLDLSNFDTSNVDDLYQNMAYMFYNCSSLLSLDLSSFDTSNVNDFMGMFGGCNSLTSLNLSSFDTSNVKNMEYMFSGCNSLTSLNLSNFDTSNVENMNYMFSGCNSLTSLDLSNFDTSNIQGIPPDPTSYKPQPFFEGFKYMFENCTSLTSLDISSFTTLKQYISTTGMFQNCSSLVSLDLSNFYIPNICETDQMFDNCASLTTIDMSNYVFNDVVENMFYNCTSLTNINLNNADGTKTYNAECMFYNCTSLTNIDLSCFIHLGMTKNMFYNCNSLLSVHFANNWSSDVDNSDEFLSCEGMFENCTDLTEVTMPLAKQIWCKYLFKNCESLETINFFSSLPNLPEVVNMGYDYTEFCKNCYNLRTINFPNSTTNKVKFLQLENTTSAFENCYNLDLDNVLSHISLFKFGYPDNRRPSTEYYVHSKYSYNCESTFKNCYQLTELNSVLMYPNYLEPEIIQDKVAINFDSCFENCINLKKVSTNISHYKVENDSIENPKPKPDFLIYTNMFKGCSLLKDVFLYGFYYYHSLEEGYYIKGMFDDCVKLQNVYVEDEDPFNQPINNSRIETEIDPSSQYQRHKPSSAFVNCTQIYNWEGNNETAQVIHANPNYSDYYLVPKKGYFQYGTKEDVFPQS